MGNRGAEQNRFLDANMLNRTIFPMCALMKDNLGQGFRGGVIKKYWKYLVDKYIFRVLMPGIGGLVNKQTDLTDKLTDKLTDNIINRQTD
jgi:hypothetical protein